MIDDVRMRRLTSSVELYIINFLHHYERVFVHFEFHLVLMRSNEKAVKASWIETNETKFNSIERRSQVPRYNLDVNHATITAMVLNMFVYFQLVSHVSKLFPALNDIAIKLD